MFIHVVFNKYVPLTFGCMGKTVAISRYAVVKNISGKDSPSTAVQASLGKNLQDILESFKKGTRTVGCLDYLKLGGGFKYVLCLHLTPGNDPILTCAYFFKWVGSTTWISRSFIGQAFLGHEVTSYQLM